ncbi:hypothetical protein [Hymenobacter rubripertinctus]|uniref:hypothetical protein n=1 Tax=Hymenobacter rubripertinctus TaxID=2029981 RepID=UPI0011C42350|nr:hypothetical protein [Hymenobacter rubripertinctus]
MNFTLRLRILVPEFFLTNRLFFTAMKQKNTRVLSTLLLGGVIALWGCEKALQPEPKPSAVQVKQLLANTESAKSTSKAQAEWLRFVERVERGEIVDPVGQYVAKGTPTLLDAEGHPIARPKCDVSLRDPNKGFALRTIRYTRSTAAISRSIDEPCDPSTLDPGSPCYQGPVGGGSSPSATVFVSSETTSTYTDAVNPNGYIYDLKIVKGELEQPLAGYYKIAVDLNRGTGGMRMFLTFTRRPSYVRLGDETGWGWAQDDISGPVREIQAFKTPTGISSPVNQPRGFVPLWTLNPVPGSTWKHPDLNDGAHGRYIYGYQFKAPSYGRPIEVGVISSNNARPVPPVGWDADYTQDLNEGAGGDYIYFCSKKK